MVAETVPVPPQVERPSRGSSVAAVVCLVVAAILTVPAAIAYWGQRTINDGQRYVSTVGPLVDSPEVQAAIATKVTAAIESQVDVEALLNQVFADVIKSKPRLAALVGPVAGAVNGLIENQVRAFIASDAFAEFWVAANTRAQQALVRVLEGESSGAVSLQDGAVVLDLSDVVDQVKQRLVDRGLTIVENAPPLPAEDREIVLLEAPQVDQVRTIYAFTNPLAKWLLVAVAALYLAALMLSRRRPRMTIIIGVLLAANALLLALMLSIGRQLFVNQLSGTVFGPASTVFFDQLLSYLDRGQRVLLWVGLMLVFVGWFTGDTKLATAVRSTLTSGLESVGSSLRDSPAAGAGRWTAANAGWMRIVIGVLGVVVLLWGNETSPSRFFWATVVVIVLLAAVQVLLGVGHAAARGPREAAAIEDPDDESGGAALTSEAEPPPSAMSNEANLEQRTR
jgi:hypothetical protein